MFVKAVGEQLVELSNIREWNYKILKQQTGQGPVHVRSKFFINIGSSFSEETSRSIDHWIKGPCEQSSLDDEELLRPIMSASCMSASCQLRVGFIHILRVASCELQVSCPSHQFIVYICSNFRF